MIEKLLLQFGGFHKRKLRKIRKSIKTDYGLSLSPMIKTIHSIADQFHFYQILLNQRNPATSQHFAVQIN